MRFSSGGPSGGHRVAHVSSDPQLEAGGGELEVVTRDTLYHWSRASEVLFPG